jgi:Outer membrane lipoprotein-sorting protein
VEVAPKEAGSAYSKRVLRVDVAEFRVMATDFYDRTGKKQKALTYGEYEKVNGKFWRAKEWNMKNLQNGKSTLIRFTQLKMENGYSINEFSTGKLGG